MKKADIPTLAPGDEVIVDGTVGIYRGPNPKIEGDVWVEFPDTGWWSYDPSDVQSLTKDAP